MSLWGRLRHNLGLKILSLLTAVIIWGTVQVQTDPLATRRKTVKVVPVDVPRDLAPVSVEPSQLTVTLTGRTSAFDRLEESNFRLLASCAKATAGECTALLRTDDLPAGLQVKDLPRKTVVVELDALASAPRPVFVEVRGHPARGFAADSWEVHPNEVTVSAPSTLLQRITRVVAEVDVSGMSSSFSGMVALVARDAANLQLAGANLYPGEVNVTIPMRQVNSKTVPVVPVLNAPPRGYEFATVTVSPPVVTLTGPAALLSAVDAVQTAPLATEKLRGGGTVAAPLRVPDGCRLTGASAVRVTIVLRPAGTVPTRPTAPATAPEAASQPDNEAPREGTPETETRSREHSAPTPAPPDETAPATSGSTGGEAAAPAPTRPHFTWPHFGGRQETPRPTPAPATGGERP